MSRSAASIQAEINVLEAFLASAESTYSSTSADGVNASRMSRRQATQRLDQLYIQKGRATKRSPMFTRGRVSGLR